MKFTNITRSILAYKRQKRDLLAAGYHHVEEPLWKLKRGSLTGEEIVDVQISTCGKELYVKTMPRRHKA